MAAEKKPVKKPAKNPVKKGGLGKGLNAMIPDNVPVKTESEGEVKGGDTMVSVNLIDVNTEQPRKNFNQDKLNELADSIKQHGIVEPLILQKKGKNRYEIVAGERRFRAAMIAKLKEVPAIIRDYEDKERVEIALIENIQREDLNSIEEANAYQRLMDEYGYRQDEVAVRVSKSRVTITNSLRLLKLDERVQQMVIDEEISGGHARALLAIEDPNLQYELAGKVFEEKLSVRETEKLVRTITKGKPETTKQKKTLEDEATYKSYEKNLITLTGTKVEIQRKDNNKGKIVIDYSSLEEFERIYDIILKGGKQ